MTNTAFTANAETLELVLVASLGPIFPMDLNKQPLTPWDHANTGAPQ